MDINNFMVQFINDYGMMIFYVVLTAIAGALGTIIKRYYDKLLTNKTTKDVVEDCVKAVQQLRNTEYAELKAKELKDKAKESIIATLSTKGIEVSEVELDVLIESCKYSLNNAICGNTIDKKDVK